MTFINMNANVLRSGAYLNLDAASFKTLVTLATYQNFDGECYPTQEQLAEVTGVSERSIYTHINRLLKYRLPDGSAILERQLRKVPGKPYTNSIYKLLPASGFTYGDQSGEDAPPVLKEAEVIPEDPKPPTPTEYNAKTVISYFRTKYQEKYETAYNMTKADWGRFNKLIKTKVIEAYPDGELVFEAIATLFEVYDDQFKKADYPAPTLWSLTNWTFQKVVAIAQDKAKTAANETDRIAREQAKGQERLDALGDTDDETIAAMFDKMNNRNKPTLTKEDEEARGF